jgi:dTDP-L-rhamnose 4-epimerase
MADTVLVTGGAGFIGSFLVDALVERGDHVIVYDNLDPQVHGDGSASDINPEAEFIRADIRDRDTLAKAVARADLVSHQAAVVGVGQSMYQVDRYVDVNTRGTATLLDILVNSKHHVRKLIVPGSMSAYGEGRYRCPRCGPVAARIRTEEQLGRGDWELHCPTCGSELIPMPTDETKPFESTSVYAITKQDQELLVLSVCRAFGLPAVSLRYFNVYGPRQSLSNPYTGAVAIFMSRLKNNRPPLIFEDGNQSRDFISVHDIVAANLAVLGDARADYGVFNVGTGRRVTILEVAELLARSLEKDIAPDITGKFRKGDIRHCFSDPSRLQAAIDWRPRVSLESGIRELIEWSDRVAAQDSVDHATEELRARGLLLG